MALTIANLIMAVLFLVSTALQYNDPDPVGWMAIYGVAALICIVWTFRRQTFRAPALVAVVALAWMATLAPSVLRAPPSFDDILNVTQMKTPMVEQAREALGLIIVALWMMVLAMAALAARNEGFQLGPRRKRR